MVLGHFVASQLLYTDETGPQTLTRIDTLLLLDPLVPLS